MGCVWTWCTPLGGCVLHLLHAFRGLCVHFIWGMRVAQLLEWAQLLGGMRVTGCLGECAGPSCLPMRVAQCVWPVMLGGSVSGPTTSCGDVG